MAAARANVSPWLDREEWRSVYHALFSENLNIKWALDRITVWKSRLPSDPLSEIDATEAIFRAKIHACCELSCTDTYYDTMLHSSAIMRFIKLISDIGQTKGVEAISRAAKQLEIPEWVVTLRHDVTHSAVPSLDMLKLGIDFALRWLKGYYWDKENERCTSAVSISDTTSLSIEDSIRRDIDKFCYLQSQKDLHATDNLVTFVNTLYSKVKHHGTILSKILTEPGYLLPTYEQLKNILNDEEMEFLNNKSTVIPESLLKYWSPVLKLYNEKSSYYCLVHNLLASSQSNCTSLHRRLVAAWIVKIFNLCKAKGKKRTVLKALPLDWSKILAEALVCYNEYCPAYLTLILEDSSVIIPEDKKQHLMALVAIRLGKTMDALPRTIAKETNKIYTIDDMQKAKLFKEDTAVEIDDTEICWKICTDPEDWRRYPIGILPGQPAPNIFDKVPVKVEEHVRNSTSEAVEVTSNITERLPKRCFQEINTIEDSESIPTKKILKHILFF